MALLRLHGPKGHEWILLRDPVEVITANEPSQVPRALETIERRVEDEGLQAAGFLAYHAGAAYGLAVRPGSPLPCLWMGLYRRSEPCERRHLRHGAHSLGAWLPSISRERHARSIERIKDLIAAGETYQVNYTFPLYASFAGDPLSLFCELTLAQEARYPAYLDTGRHVVCSVSPELFFSREGRELLSRPMKGTARRGLTPEEDERCIEELRQSEKDRAENLMIVDMIRNDMGRIAETGSVEVPSLFDIERYPTLLQMTSTVRSRTSSSLAGIMEAMFPCASITGAPKIRTMQIIRDLEEEPRGLYTGAIGWIGAGGRTQFNVAIRTVVVDREEGSARYGVGGGIVWDSDAGREYEECLLKARVLAELRPPFRLLETLRWTPADGFFLLEEHLGRLARSADYHGFALDAAAVRRALADVAGPLTTPARVRLLLARDGAIAVEAAALPPSGDAPIRVGLASAPVDSRSPWLYHKTTRREIYEKALASRPDCDEVLLWNERDEVTEAATANVIARLDGRLVTPPVSSGLLAGTLRQALLHQGRIAEAVLTRRDLARCEQLWLVNSVRLWRQAVLVPAVAAANTAPLDSPVIQPNS